MRLWKWGRFKTKKKSKEKEDEKEAVQAVNTDVVKEGANEPICDTERAENMLEDILKTDAKPDPTTAKMD